VAGAGAGGGAEYHRKTGRLRHEVVKACARVASGLRPICATRRLLIKYANIALRKLPYLLVVGDKEKAADVVAVRARGNQDLGQMSLDTIVERWQDEAHSFMHAA
jgi:threonyl-tRNA synthetase